jgi:hypothetical protein
MQLMSADKKKKYIPVGRTGYRWKTADAGNLHLTRDCCVMIFIHLFLSRADFPVRIWFWSEVSVIFAFLLL